MCFAFALVYKHLSAAGAGAVPDASAHADTADALAIAEQSADDFTLSTARLARGVVLVSQDGPARVAGLQLLEQIREAARGERFSMTAVPVVDIFKAAQKRRLGDVDGAIELIRAVIGHQLETGAMLWRGLATNVLVESLLDRGADGDREEAEAAIARLAAAFKVGAPVARDIWLLRLRALFARACGDEAGFREYRDRHGALARSLGFEGHIKWAEAMP
jgi:adenylate cyclase